MNAAECELSMIVVVPRQRFSIGDNPKSSIVLWMQSLQRALTGYANRYESSKAPLLID